MKKKPINKGEKSGPVAPKTKAELLAEELIVSSNSDVHLTSEEIVTLAAGKPPKGKIFRVHPTARLEIRVLRMKVGVREEKYIVAKSVASKLDYVVIQTAFLCVTDDAIPFLWLIGVGDDTWSVSARRIASDAMTVWQRLVSHTPSGTYRKRPQPDIKHEPDFQGIDKKPFAEILAMAFDQDHIIDSLDHEAAKKNLSGE